MGSRIHNLYGLSQIFILFIGMVVLILHVIGAASSLPALFGQEACHTYQRRHHVALCILVVCLSSCTPTLFKVLGEDVLLRFPPVGVCVVESALQVGVGGAVVGLYNAIVEQLGQSLVEVIGHAVNGQQFAGTRGWTQTLARPSALGRVPTRQTFG